MSKTLQEVITDLQDREMKGLKEYGTTIDRPDYSLLMWLDEAYTECLDMALYLKCAMNKLKVIINEEHTRIQEKSERFDKGVESDSD